MKNKVLGVGITDAPSVVFINGKWKVSPEYQRWRSMLARCYCPIYLNRFPTYAGNTVCEEWLTFSNFKNWMETQDWVGKQLDKDLLGNGKLYSPDTCCFISRALNTFFTDRKLHRGSSKVGVCYHKTSGKYQATCSNPFTGKYEYLGLYATELEAHKIWKEKKHQHAVGYAAMETDPRIKQALLKRYCEEL